MRWVQSSASLDALPREVAVSLQSAGMKQVQDLVKMIKQVIKDKGVLPTAKLRALQLLSLCMETQHPALSTCVVRQMLKRLKLMGIQGHRAGTLFPGAPSQESTATAAFLQLLMRCLREWSESTALGEREKQAYQEACRQLQNAGVIFPKKSGTSRVLSEYRESGSTLMRLLSMRNPDLMAVHEAAEVVRNVMAVLQADIEARIESDLSAEALFEIHEYLELTLTAYKSWLPTGDPKLPAQIHHEAKEWTRTLVEPKPMDCPADLEEDLDANINYFESSYLSEPASFFVLLTQNFEDPIDEDVTKEKLAGTVLPT